ncbi:MAG: hydantoinase/oxoprolinase family protein [Proteobacteria bacterium]|nr:hydantoinase/oxoprolinase family protein [Pseudomonadota bacterium]
MTEYRLGVDIGGTFTDILLLGPKGAVFTKKVLSTPDDYSRAIQEGVSEMLREIGVGAAQVSELSHGTTIATNAIIERKGVRVALVATKGFRDVLELGRFRLPRLYDLDFRKPRPLVERPLRFEVPERILASGEVRTPVDMAAVDALAETLKGLAVDAVAICFMNSYANPAHERLVAARLRERLPGVTVTASTELVPQIQEYERTSTTVVNAYIRPVVESYLKALSAEMRSLGIKVPLMIMQSSGGILPAEAVAESPVFIIESGPAAGVVGAQRLGQRIGLRDLMVLDMGGTTAKASLIEEGAYQLSPEIEVGGEATAGHRLIQGNGYVVQFPTLVIAEVGAGGGSIAWIDAVGGLKVGPRSAGAAPGPVCYDLGGELPTVTDANLLLGYLNPEALVGGDLKVNYPKAEAVLADLGRGLGLDPTATAHGIHRIANANMMRALTAVSSERGRDPRQFMLLAMGGNGGVHATGLAEALGIKRVVVPPVAGLFSALGLLFADVEHTMIRAFYHELRKTGPEDFNAVLKPLFKQLDGYLRAEGFTGAGRRELRAYADVKYVSQGSSLTIPLARFPVDAKGLALLAEGFGDEHERTYGYRSDDEPLQIVALRAIGRGVARTSRVPERVAREGERVSALGERRAYFGQGQGWRKTPLMPRRALAGGRRNGPLIVEEYDTTTVVPPGWRASLDSWNNIVIDKARG